MRTGLFISALLVIANLANAQPFVSSSFEKDSIQIGEQVVFRINIESEEAIKSIVPDIKKSFSSGLEVLHESLDSISDSSHKYIFKYLLTSFDSGVYEVDTVEMLINDGKKADTLFAPSKTLVVYSPSVDTTAEIRDIKDPFKTPLTFKELLSYWEYSIPLVALLLIFILILFFMRRRKIKELPKEVIPAHIKALNNLNHIKEEKLWQQGKVKEYYTQLSDTVRVYIEDRFNIPAMESVTWEILDDFKKHSYDDDYLMEILENLLSLSDLVKFAKEDPDPTENETNLNQAFILVEKTKPVDELKNEDD